MHRACVVDPVTSMAHSNNFTGNFSLYLKSALIDVPTFWERNYTVKGEIKQAL